MGVYASFLGFLVIFVGFLGDCVFYWSFRGGCFKVVYGFLGSLWEYFCRFLGVFVAAFWSFR